MSGAGLRNSWLSCEQKEPTAAAAAVAAAGAATAAAAECLAATVGAWPWAKSSAAKVDQGSQASTRGDIDGARIIGLNVKCVM